MNAEKDSLSALLEARYRSAPWGTNVYHDQAAAILSNYVLIPKVDLPAVNRSKPGENVFLTDNDNVVFTSPENARRWVYRDVAVWQFLAYEEEILAAQEEAMEAKRVSERRDELAAEFTAVNSYGGQLPYTQKLIDRIITLEEASK